MPTGDPVPNVLSPRRRPPENQLPIDSPADSPSATEPRAAMTSKSAAIAARTNYVSPYRQAAQSRSASSPSVARATAGNNNHSPNFKDIVNRFNTKQDEKVPAPTNRIPATAGFGAGKSRRVPQRSNTQYDDMHPANRPKNPSRPPSAATKRSATERSVSAQSTYSTASAGSSSKKTDSRRPSTSLSNGSDRPNARVLPPLQTSFGDDLKVIDNRYRRRRAASESHSPSAASLADNEEGTNLSSGRTLHHRRSRSNVELSTTPDQSVVIDPLFSKPNTKNSPRSPTPARSGIPVPTRSPSSQASDDSGGRTSQQKKHTLKNIQTSAHGSRHPQQRVKSPALNAIVTSQQAKRSPPLRSTKGQRLPAAATATTASSRQRVQNSQPPPSSAKENRLPGNKYPQRRRNATLEESKPKNTKRNIPELGTIDFAARRARIQSAFTKSLKEEEERPKPVRRGNSKQSLNGEIERVSTPVQRIDEVEEENSPMDVEIIQVVPERSERQDESSHDAKIQPSEIEQEQKESTEPETEEAEETPAITNPECAAPTGEDSTDKNMVEEKPGANLNQDQSEVAQPVPADVTDVTAEAADAVPEPLYESPRIMPRSRTSSVLSRSRSSSVGRRNRVSAIISGSGLDTEIILAEKSDDPELEGLNGRDQLHTPPATDVNEVPAKISHSTLEALSEPISVVVTPGSPRENLFAQVSEMLRPTSAEWSTESEMGGYSPDSRVGARHSLNGYVSPMHKPAGDGETVSRLERASINYKWTSGTPSGYETVSPMLSTATSDDRATIASLFERYDEPREDFLKSYENSPEVSRNTPGGFCHSAGPEMGSVTELEDDGQHYEEEDCSNAYTSCSEVLSSTRPSANATSDEDWSSSEPSPQYAMAHTQRPASRPESPTTPRQMIEAESPLPPTPPPKDIPTPPPKDIPTPPLKNMGSPPTGLPPPPPPPEKDIGRVSPSLSLVSPRTQVETPLSAQTPMFLPEIETDSEPLGLAIQSLPSHYDFRPHPDQPRIQAQQSSFNAPPHPYIAWQPPATDQYSTHRPSLETTQSYISRYSPSSSYTDVDSRRSSGPNGHRPSETPATSMATMPIPGRGSPSLQSEEQFPVARELTPQQKMLKKRQHLMKEILDTESAFFRDMTVAEEIYKGSANACSSITQDDIKVLFGNTGDIVHFSKAFLETIKAAVASVYVMRRGASGLNSSAASVANSTNSDDRVGGYMEDMLTEEEKDRKTYIGEAFAENLYRMEKVYGDYCKNHDAALTRLQKLEMNKGVAIWLAECKACAEDLTNAWNLESLLIKPVQRILKYPLLLTQLLECTPRSHPDYAALEASTKEMKFAADRINEMKKRKDMVEKIVGRKRNESDIRHGISKGFARQAEKLRQSVGLSEVVVDDTYNRMFENYNMHFVQVQVISRDIEVYVDEIQSHVEKLALFMQTFREFAEVAPSQHPEVELKWRKLDASMKEIVATYLQEHRHRVRKHCIGPLETLLKMHESPQRIMTKRNKKAVDYARYKAIKDRGDKPDKRTTDLADAYIALNETLIDELPRLFILTKKLIDTVLMNFIELQAQWMSSWAAKMKMTFVELEMPQQLNDVVKAFMGDFSYNEQLLSQLTICNGTLVNMQFPTVDFMSPSSTTLALEAFEPASLRPRTANDGHKEPSFTNGRERSSSLTSRSPTTATTFGAILDKNNMNDRQDSEGSDPRDIAGNLIVQRVHTSGPRLNGPQTSPLPNPRLPTRSPSAPAQPNRSYTPANATERHVSANYEPRGAYSLELPPPVLPSTSFFDRPDFTRFTSNQSFPEHNDSHSIRDPSPPPPVEESLFSSAMPMEDDHDTTSRANSPAPTDALNIGATLSRTSSYAESTRRRTLTLSNNDKAMFVAASLYEFNISRERREAGFPYLTYVQGEIFDVIGIKGEIWLAKNQDDAKGEIGWIWCKHFARLPDDFSN